MDTVLKAKYLFCLLVAPKTLDLKLSSEMAGGLAEYVEELSATRAEGHTDCTVFKHHTSGRGKPASFVTEPCGVSCNSPRLVP